MCRAHNIPEYRQDDGAIRPLTSSAEARYGAILADLRRLHSVLATEVGDSDFVSELRVDLTDLNGSERSKLAAATTDIQLTSKLWLLEELFKQVPMGGLTILVLGGWCGVLPWLARLIGRRISRSMDLNRPRPDGVFYWQARLWRRDVQSAVRLP